MRKLMPFLKLSLVLLLIHAHVGIGAAKRTKIERQTPLVYINTLFENGSPLHWDIQPDGTILISLMYDHERSSLNRAAGHWHFQVRAKAGADLTLVLQNFYNIWNEMPASAASENTSCYISQDGRNWTSIPTEKIEDERLKIRIHMESDSLYIARLEPYRVSDLQQLLDKIRNHPLVKIVEIGRTAEGRPLEIVRVGHTNSPHRIFIRGRAHAWEPGGNWVIKGLIDEALRNDQKSTRFLEMYCLYILPMANKDRVARGGTRFNMRGMDLNRKWDRPADPGLAPENAALETWLGKMIKRGLKPHLAIDFHNDGGGNLHIARPNINLESYLANMERFELLLRKHTWFTEGSTGSSFRNPGSIGEGLLERFGIDAVVYELNANWIEGLYKVPLGHDWELLGRQLHEVFYEYFSTD